MVVHARRLRTMLTSSTGRGAPIPAGFGDHASRAPVIGTITLPLRLWGPGHRTMRFDVKVRSQRRFAYQQILSYGTETDVQDLIYPALLVGDWAELFVTETAIEIWTPWYEQHRHLVA